MPDTLTAPPPAQLIRNEPMQARSTARLAALLDAAAAVVADIGYERLTTAMVAEGAGASIGTKGFVTGVTLFSTATLPSAAKVNEAWYLPIGSFAYVSAAKTWIGHIPTAKLASGKMYSYRVNLSDGTSFTVTFGVR